MKYSKTDKLILSDILKENEKIKDLGTPQLPKFTFEYLQNF